MSTIPDFNDTKLWIVRTAMTERYGKTVAPQLADRELRLNLDSSILTNSSTACANNTAPTATITPTFDLIKKTS